VHPGYSRSRTRLGFLVLVSILVMPFSCVEATSAVYSAMGGAEVGAEPRGVPVNPAAAAAVTHLSLQFGTGLPVGDGLVGYAAFYEPRDDRGVGAAVPGILGAMQTKRVNGLDAGTGRLLYHISTTFVYHLVPFRREYGAFGLGLRLLQDEDQVNQTKGRAWRVDLGWQALVLPQLSLGVVARGVLGTDMQWSDASTTPRVTDWRAGAALKLTEEAHATLDISDFRNSRPGSWGLGVDWALMRALSVRAGYSMTGGIEQGTLGFGARLGTWQIDASSTLGASPKGTLGASLRF
jgi:hypothetical protein